MAASLTKTLLFQVAQQSVLQRPWLCASGTQSVRWRVRRRKKWLEEDQKKTDWMEPMLEYRKEKEAQEPQPASKLHVVRRVEALKGRPWWEKKIMERLGLDVKRNTPVIHKNTPRINRLLQDVKHLIAIQPLSLPQGLPSDPADYPHTTLSSQGELRVIPTLRPVSGDPAGGEIQDSKWELQIDTVKKELRRKLDRYEVHAEYVKPHIQYKMNQDGKEYRYTQCFNQPKKATEQ